MSAPNGTERRSYIRIVYPPGAAAGLRVGADRLDIADISQCGLRVFVPETESLRSRFRATVHLLCGGRLDIEADPEWVESGVVGCSLTDLIPAALIDRELRYVTTHFS